MCRRLPLRTKAAIAPVITAVSPASTCTARKARNAGAVEPTWPPTIRAAATMSTGLQPLDAAICSNATYKAAYAVDCLVRRASVVLLLMRAEELKGHLDTLLLAALEDGPRHGYAVMEALRQSTGGRLDLPTGTIYPALHRLEQAGLIAGSWSVVAGRRRRLYELTPAGRQALSGRRADWRGFSAMVTAALEGSPWPTPPR